MAAIRGKNTEPERTVRKYLHSAGLRFSLHSRKLPGRPDIVLPKYGVVVFVHGCFWHRHKNCRFATMPQSNVQFWSAKLSGNVDRDKRNARKLRLAGWRVLTIWECQISEAKLAALVRRIRK